jgi:protein-S-isoprenylcysteine O-methyltransferase Ste14
MSGSVSATRRPASFGLFLVDYRVVISSLLCFGLMVSYFVNGRPPHGWAVDADAIGACGALCVGLGLLMRTWAAGTLYKGQALAVTGPFSLCRHPLYLGSFAMIVGFMLIVGNLVEWLLAISVLVVVYRATIANEERRLAERYAANWHRYAATTPRLIPRFAGYAHAPWRLGLWLRNREYRAVVAAVAGMIVLECFG